MRTSILFTILVVSTCAWAESTETIVISESAPKGKKVTGRVFEDKDGDGKFTKGVDRPLPRVGVSDQINVLATDTAGGFALTCPPEAKVVYCTVPSGYRCKKFYHLLVDPTTTATDTISTGALEFALTSYPVRDPQNIRFVQSSDIHVAKPEDGKLFNEALDEVNRLHPPAQFLVATGDLTNIGDRKEEFDVYVKSADTCRIPFFHVFGNHDQNKGEDRTANYRHYLGPDYYSADVGDNHLVMLNSVHPSDQQKQWLDRDLALLGRDKKIFVFQHYAPKLEELAWFQSYKVRAIFSGHWHSNKITVHDNGMADINHPTFLMGGIDGSPASFRVVSIRGEQINSEFRYADFEKKIWIAYPREDLSGPDQILAGIYDTCSSVLQAQFSARDAGGNTLAGGKMKHVSRFSWMADLPPKTANQLRKSAGAVELSVNARNSRGESWGTKATISTPRKLTAAKAVKTEADWPVFMGNSQRTGVSKSDLKLPLKLRWFTPTKGAVDLASPVLFKGRLAIGVKDRDNLINNGVGIIDAKSGKLEHFIKTDSAINHSPAFAEDPNDGPGIVYAVSVGGTIYSINPDTGRINSTGKLAQDQERWVYTAPAAQENLVILGSTPALTGMSGKFGEKRWLSDFGQDWISSYASPVLAGDLVIMGGHSINKDKKPASVYALDVNSGNVRWTNPVASVSGSVSVYNGRGYVLQTRGMFKCFDVATGKDLATKQLEKNWSFSTPAVAADIVVVPTAAGAVYALDPQTLEEKWVFRSGPGMWNLEPYGKDKTGVFSSATITPTLVFIGSSDGKLYALDRATGQAVWSYDIGVPTLATPCISGNTLFTAAYDGNVYAFTGQ